MKGWLAFILVVPLMIFSQNRSSEEISDLFIYRNLGPFRAGAWISDIAAPQSGNEQDKTTFYVAARNGGLWKTINNGTTFVPIFDNYGVNAIGAVEVAPSDANIVWVGTGDDSNARSAYYGNGIYKSLDGGQTFTNMGLKDSHHIGKIIIHPKNPDIVYAAVMGHLFSPNQQRGVFKTINGGETWEKVLYINDRVGIADLCQNPKNPDIVYAAAYDQRRTPWHFEAGGENSRIYLSMDGGKHWEKLGGGLPQGKLGRIGVDVFRQNPAILYAVIQNLNPKPGLIPKKIEFDEFRDSSYDHLMGGEVYWSDDYGDTWKKVSPLDVDVSGKAAYSFNEITNHPINPDIIYIIGVTMQYSLDGGKTWATENDRQLFKSNFGDVRTFWINPIHPDHLMLGSDGGIYASYDGGKHMHHFYHIPLGEVYQVEVDNDHPYNIYAGLQDHEIWKGPVNSWSGSVGIEDWLLVGLWDGMYAKVAPDNNRWLYFTSQFGKHHRVDQLLGERVDITPKASAGEPFYRFTWTAPIALSPHQADTIYAGAQMLLKSENKGDTWAKISPDLTDNDPLKIAGQGHMMFCTITTISESPLKKGVIWVGTDDGKIHVTDNNGQNWRNLTAALCAAGALEHTWVSRVIASFHHADKAYVCKSGYREDDFKAYVFRTANQGRNWENISGDLPGYPVSVICESRENPDLLFIGNDIGVYYTLDCGKHWVPLKNNMPPVPVRDLLIHPREKDLVVGTYGRGVWVTHMAPLEEISSSLSAKNFHLFKIIDTPVNNSSPRAWWGNYHMTGDNHLVTPNQTPGFKLFYYKKPGLNTKLTLKVFKNSPSAGEEIPLSQDAGYGFLYWLPADKQPGEYRFELSDGIEKQTQTATLKPTIHFPIGFRYEDRG